jgi:hypothetical protein
MGARGMNARKKAKRLRHRETRAKQRAEVAAAAEEAPQRQAPRKPR